MRNLLGKAEECPGLPLVDAYGGVGVQRRRCRLISHSLHHHPGQNLLRKITNKFIGLKKMIIC